MKVRNALMGLGLTVAVAGTAPVSAQEVSGSVGADVASAYIFRGATVNDEVNVQPYIEAGVGSFTFGTWANLNTDSEQFDEIDYYVSYDVPLPEDSGLGLSLGYTEYTYPTSVDALGAGTEADREVSVSLSADTFLAPYAMVAIGLEGPFLDEGLYVEVGIGHEVEVSDGVTLSAGASLGYEGGDNYAENGLSHALLSAGASYGPASVSLNYVVETDDDVLVVDEDFFVTVGVGI